MKLVCHRGALSTAFQTVSGVVPTRTPKPVLQNVKLEAAKGHAVLVGTDSEVAIRYRVAEADIQEPGDVLLPTSRVLAILREMQGDTVSLETTDSGTCVRGERAEYKLPMIDPAEFPAVAEFEETNSYSIQAGALKQMIRRTIFATDAESTRYALGGPRPVCGGGQGGQRRSGSGGAFEGHATDRAQPERRRRDGVAGRPQ
jgi:DNA polymerase III subunit beta